MGARARIDRGIPMIKRLLFYAAILVFASELPGTLARKLLPSIVLLVLWLIGVAWGLAVMISVLMLGQSEWYALVCSVIAMWLYCLAVWRIGSWWMDRQQ